MKTIEELIEALDYLFETDTNDAAIADEALIKLRDLEKLQEAYGGYLFSKRREQ